MSVHIERLEFEYYFGVGKDRMTVLEAADVLGVTPQSIRWMLRKKLIRGVQGKQRTWTIEADSLPDPKKTRETGRPPKFPGCLRFRAVIKPPDGVTPAQLAESIQNSLGEGYSVMEMSCH